MTRPNLFTYATKERSQDAVICWLIEWSANDSYPDLNALGRRFVESLLSRDGQEGKEVLGGAIESTEIEQQYKGIDVLARINGKHVLLIEDKTKSNPHGDQLKKYREAVLSGKTKFGEVSAQDLFPIYLKTGNQPLAMDRVIEDARYKVFNRANFLDVLRNYRGKSEIVSDFRCYLESLDRDTKSFQHWRRTDPERKWAACEGLYLELERRLFPEERRSFREYWWGYVSNRAGGFMCFSLASPNPYLQLEWEKLCFKVNTSEWPREDRHRLKWEWSERITCQDDERRLVRPPRMKLGKTMTVAVHQDGWLRYNKEDMLDLDATVESLRKAEQVRAAAESACDSRA